MSFKAVLHIEDHQVNVLTCEYEFYQETDVYGKPAAKPMGGKIFLTIESTSLTDFMEWMLAPGQTKSGKIVFYRRDNHSKLKELSFTDAYCTYFKEYFDADGLHSMQIKLVLSAKEIKMGSAVFENAWAV